MELQNKQNTKNEKTLEDACTYEIRVEGRMGETWSNWFEGISITLQNNTTILTGDVVDQSALRGVLNKIWDLNLTLISVCRLKKGGNPKHKLNLKVERKNNIEKGGEKQ